MDSADDVPADPTPAPLPRDALTIRRILLLTAGVAAGLKVFAPESDQPLVQAEGWLLLANAVVIGLSLPAPFFLMGSVRRARTLGPGSMFAATMGVGSWLLLPPPLIGRSPAALLCSYYAMPLVAAWFLLATLLTRQVNRRLFDRAATPWTERYGYVLALLWAPLGVYHLVLMYREVF
jgi:hypothetical protein